MGLRRSLIRTYTGSVALTSGLTKTTLGSVDPSPELFLDLLRSFLADEIKNMAGYFVFLHPREGELRCTQPSFSSLPAQHTQWDRRREQGLMEFTWESGIVGYLNELSHARGLGDKDHLHRITRDPLQQSVDELEEFVKAGYFSHWSIVSWRRV